MLEQVHQAPPDAILGLTEAFKADPNPDKINLGVGVYVDDQGRTPVLETVKQAEQRLLAQSLSRSYLPMTGDADYTGHVQRLMFGAEHPRVTSGRLATAQTPGGTGALRVAADYLAKLHRTSKLWLSDPTWANHPAIFKAAGHTPRTYAWFDSEQNTLAFDEMIADLGKVDAGDVVLLHGCCHNPSGLDPSPEQWTRIAEVLAQRHALPMVDFAYQGFGDGLEQDAAGLRILAEHCPEMIICSSFSKNFGLYCERVGAVTFCATDADAAARVASQLKLVIRTNYSNPPAHGARIVATILGDDQLAEQWLAELAGMRQRIHDVRAMLVDRLAAAGVTGDLTYLTRQRGMFGFSGLNRDQVTALRERHAVYLVDSGRINVAGVTSTNIDRLAAAIADVAPELGL